MPPVALVVLGLVFLVGGAYVLVEGASRIAFIFGISELVVGLTIVAIGTSAPELAVVVASAVQQKAGTLTGGSELIIGNVVGSNIANIGLILGVSAFVAAINVPRAILEHDFLWLTIATVLVGMFAWNGHFSFIEGVILLMGMTVFSGYQYRIATRERHASAAAKQAAGGDTHAVDYAAIAKNAVMVLVGVIALAAGSNWLINGSSTIALELGISEYLIGLTLVAVGTSLPELSTSIVGSMRGEGDLIVGNIIGSNIYNLLLILASGMVITTINVPDQVREVQIPLMIGLTFALYPILRSGGRIQRREGLMLFGAYAFITGLAFYINPAA